ncbi:MAG: CYTH domain-containing protein [Gemmatimonadota bacterium]|nr:CYTH domain-containing protein [Gemmatimonadota bacterium]
MREVELKAVLESWDEGRVRLMRAGATRTFVGRLEDRRYDTHDRSLVSKDIVLRLRTYRDSAGERAELEFKGPTAYEQGYKVREEIGSTVLDAESVAFMLLGLGYLVTRAIDRDIEQFELGEAVVRFERYPRMDDLVEVEGEPEAIERAIETLGIPRARFNADRLTDFAARYEARTGTRAATADAELSGGAPAVREL